MISAYEPSPINGRATKAEVTVRRNRLLAIVREMRPMTVRQVYYQATVHGLVEKTEAGYKKVQTDLVLMRHPNKIRQPTKGGAQRCCWSVDSHECVSNRLSTGCSMQGNDKR
jgi:hypothetical protein